MTDPTAAIHNALRIARAVGGEADGPSYYDQLLGKAGGDAKSDLTPGNKMIGNVASGMSPMAAASMAQSGPDGSGGGGDGTAGGLGDTAGGGGYGSEAGNADSAGGSPAGDGGGTAGGAMARGGSVTKTLKLLQDEFPTVYMPHVGRQVMQDGGVPSPMPRQSLKDMVRDVLSGTKSVLGRQKFASGGDAEGKYEPDSDQATIDALRIAKQERDREAAMQPVVDPMGGIAMPPAENTAKPGAYDRAMDVIGRIGGAVGEPIRAGVERYGEETWKAAEDAAKLARESGAQSIEQLKTGQYPAALSSLGWQALGAAGIPFAPLTAAAKIGGEEFGKLTGNPEAGHRAEFVLGFADPSHAGMLARGANRAREIVQMMQPEDIAKLAIFAGPKTADPIAQEARQRAIAMRQSEGAFPGEVWRETMWGERPNKQEFYEIPDQGSVYNPNEYIDWAANHFDMTPEQIINTGTVAPPLESVFKHDELYRAYPELKEMPVVIENQQQHERMMQTLGSDYGGYYDPATKSIVLAPKVALDPEKGRSVILHEVQHWVQEHEGAPFGTNVAAATEARRVATMITGQAAQTIDQIANANLERARYVLQEMENFGADYRPSERMAPIIEEAIRQKAKNPNLTDEGALAKAMSEADPDFQTAMKNMREYQSMAYATPYEIYQRKAGEVEARNVQARQDFPTEERRERAPWMTQDTFYDQQFETIPGRFGLGSSAISPTVQRAIDTFGTTRDYREAGYILPDGTMLDFSGRHQTGDYERVGTGYRPVAGQRDWMAGERYVDHREISDIIGEGPNESMMAFMGNEGAIRNKPGVGIESSVIPSPKQIETAVAGHNRNYRGDSMMVELSDPATGNIIASKEFERPTVEAVQNWYAEQKAANPNIRSLEAPAAAPAASAAPQVERELSPLGLYSVGREAALTLKQEKGAPQQMTAMLKSAGVKPAELENAGIIDAQGNLTPEWANRKSVTREELAEAIQKGNPEVKETVFTSPDKANYRPEEITEYFDELPENTERIWEIGNPENPREHYNIHLTRDGDYEVYNANGSHEFTGRDFDGTVRALNEEIDNVRGWEAPNAGARFEEYTLPGGTNYREVILHTPEKEPSFQYEEMTSLPKDKYAVIFEPTRPEGSQYGVVDLSDDYATKNGLVSYGWHGSRDRANEVALQEINVRNKIRAEEDAANRLNFNESHHDVPNALLHMRMKDREIVPPENSIEAIEEKIRNANLVPTSNPKEWGSGIPELAFVRDIITPEEAATYSRYRGFKNMLSNRPGVEQKVLHVDEIQSDWAQKGRDRGFEAEVDRTAYNRAKEILNGMTDAYHQDMKNIIHLYRDNTINDVIKTAKEHGESDVSALRDRLIERFGNDWTVTNPTLAPGLYNRFFESYRKMEPEQKLIYQPYVEALDQRAKQIVDQRTIVNRLAREAAQDPIPKGPYVQKTEQWVDLALKRALNEAAKGDYNKIAFTQGLDQADRYGLHKQLKRITFMPEGEGQWMVGSELPNGGNFDRASGLMDEKQIAEMFGKEVADKVKEGKFSGTEGNKSYIEGDDLRAGGKGMFKFYDEIVPKRTRELLKKLDKDAQVKTEFIATSGEPWPYPIEIAHDGDKYWLKSKDPRQSNEGKHAITPKFNSYEEADNIRKGFMEGRTTPVYTVEMTPKLKEAIGKGLPAYKRGGSVVDKALMVASKYA